MKNKCYAILIMAFLIISSLSACSSQTNSNSTTLIFSQYYQDADDFEEISPLLKAYFDCIQSAYDNSDKKDLNTFILPDEYINISKQLSEISNDNSDMIVDGKTNTSNEYIGRLQLIEPYLQIEVKLQSKEMLQTSNTSNEKWFTELNSLLSEIYSEYKNGDGK